MAFDCDDPEPQLNQNLMDLFLSVALLRSGTCAAPTPAATARSGRLARLSTGVVLHQIVVVAASLGRSGSSSSAGAYGLAS